MKMNDMFPSQMEKKAEEREEQVRALVKVGESEIDGGDEMDTRRTQHYSHSSYVQENCQRGGKGGGERERICDDSSLMLCP